MVRADFPTPSNREEKGWWLESESGEHGYIRGKERKRMTYHHLQRPPAYILLKIEPRERNRTYDKRTGLDGGKNGGRRTLDILDGENGEICEGGERE